MFEIHHIINDYLMSFNYSELPAVVGMSLEFYFVL